MSSGQKPFVTVVIPAYNEEHRLPATLGQVVSYLQEKSHPWQIVVVDDGSSDHTVGVAEEFVSRYPQNISLLKNPHCGKAYTVRTGVLRADSQYIILCDADLSMPVEDLDKLLQALQDGYEVVIGSREAPGSRRYHEPYYRHVMGRIFNWVVQLVALPGVRDTQCGFKGFAGEAARHLFQRLRLYTSPEKRVKGPMVTGYDVEVLFLARRRGYLIKEVPIQWRYVPGSKVNPLKDGIRMLGDVLRVRWNAMRGHYG